MMKKFRGGQRLLSWYYTHRRDLPWRRTKDPYKIWVSEIMLQQTTIETVIPYYEKFLKRFPTVESLAAAGEEEVLRYWSGLGYYSRARNLLKSAKIIAEQCREGRGHVSSSPASTRVARVYARSRAHSRPSCHHMHGNDGLREVSLVPQKHTPCLPLTVTDWQKLPGIGRYTAGAIASIAFGERVPVVDGNVIRVLSRLFRIGSHPKSPAGQKIFWSHAALILPDHDAGDFNQALMELGATLCTPKRPACLICPLFSECGARREGNPESYPRLPKRTPSEKVLMAAALIRRGETFLLVRRPAKGILKEMWEFPMVEGGPERLVRNFGFKPIRPLGSVRHSVLNKRLFITPYLCEMKRLPRLKSRWIRPDQIDQIPSSSMNHKIISIIK